MVKQNRVAFPDANTLSEVAYIFNSYKLQYFIIIIKYITKKPTTIPLKKKKTT